ncbi:MAG TPA: hypothetical protein VGZ22_15505, partial [Isosphaeraceae bacterium]|nr:hypothetical protein [Isosphaeraceae bacterium]
LRLFVALGTPPPVGNPPSPPLPPPPVAYPPLPPLNTRPDPGFFHAELSAVPVTPPPFPALDLGNDRGRAGPLAQAPVPVLPPPLPAPGP